MLHCPALPYNTPGAAVNDQWSGVVEHGGGEADGHMPHLLRLHQSTLLGWGVAVAVAL